MCVEEIMRLMNLVENLFNIPFSQALDQGNCFCIWGGAPHLRSALQFTTLIQAVLHMYTVGKDWYRTWNLVVPRRMLNQLS